MVAPKSRLLIPACMLLILASGPEALAQTNEEIFEQFQWNFSTPGARANAMGRAFIASADDATASVTNPAGLIALTRPQFYVEFKTSDPSIARFAAINSLFTGATLTFGETVNALSFFDVAVPLGSRVSVAFTRHEFLNHREKFHLSSRVIPNHPTELLFGPVDADVDFQGVSYAGSGALAVHDRLRIGLAVSFNRLEGRSVSTRREASRLGVGQFDWGEGSIIINESRVDDDDTAAGFTVGGLFRPNDVLSFGMVYSKGPRFRLQEEFRTNPGRARRVNEPLRSIVGFPKDISIDVPDRFGVGVSWRPAARWLAVFDAVHIQYSDLAERLTPVLRGPVPVFGPLPPSLTRSEFAIDDATEVHLGGEFNLVSGRNPLFVRGGVFTNPDHRLRYVGRVDARTDAAFIALFNFGERDTEVGGTVGGGIAVGPRWQADVAYVWSDSLRELVVSTAVRF